MKLKDIAKLCASTNRISISDVNGTQWLGNGYACYPVYGLPELDTDTVAAVLDFDESKQEAIRTLRLEMEDYYDLSDTVSGEETLTNVVLRFLHGGKTIDAWTTEDGRIVFINASLTKPYFADEDEARLYLRYTKGGKKYIVGKSGMFVSAVIAPFEFKQEDAETMRTIFGNLTGEMQNIVNRLVYIPAVDPHTGEVLDDR